MSDDLHDTEAAPAPSTRDLVLLLLQRMGRVEAALGIGEADTQPLSGRVNRLIAEVAEIKDELKSVRRFAFDAVGEMGRMHRDVEERVRALEHPEGAKQ